MDILTKTGILEATREEQLEFLAQLPKVMLAVQTAIQAEDFIIGRIYSRENQKCEYCFIDWNGEIRFLNISNSTFWKGTLKSAKYRRYSETKVKRIPFSIGVSLIGSEAIAKQFTLKEK